MSGVQVVLVTAPSEEVATTLARALVEEGLAACVNVVPRVRSIYRWQGEVRDDAESLMIIKTTTPRVPSLTARVTELHPYEVPEVLALEVGSGLPGYLDWVRAETSDPEE